MNPASVGSQQNECGSLLLLRKVGPAAMGATRELDHWLGRRYGPSHIGLLYRLHMVRRSSGWMRLGIHPLLLLNSAQMITTALNVGSDGAINLGAGPTFGILIAILFTHGLVCSAATAVLARLNIFYVIVNGKLHCFTSEVAIEPYGPPLEQSAPPSQP